MSLETPERIASLLEPFFRLGEFTWIDRDVDGYTIPDKSRLLATIESLREEMAADQGICEVTMGRIRLSRDSDSGNLSVSLELGMIDPA